MRPHMTPAQREAFLADVHVGVLSVAEAGRGPCTVPVWYRYAPGDVVRITAPRESRKIELLRAAGRASLCVQQEALPNKYVSVEGPVEIAEVDVAEDQRVIAVRYLGPKLAQRYLTSMASGLSTEVLITLRPERWWSVDFSQMTLR